VTKTSKRNQSAAMLRLARQGADVLALSPSVASSRLMRLAGQHPTAAVMSLGNMGLEKMTTFGHAWMAMASAGMQAQFKLAMAMWAPRSSASARVGSDHAGKHLTDAALAIVSSSMKPLHARVKRNASKRKRR
jgi:hypothetical protein